MEERDIYLLQKPSFAVSIFFELSITFYMNEFENLLLLYLAFLPNAIY
jgi:hypothetical protein